MARVKNSKSGSKPASGANIRSRAAKRETSPSINTDKSLKDAPRSSNPINVLAARTNAGVSKSKRTKAKSRSQRLRQEKGMARAEAVMDHLEKKVEGFKKKERRRRARKGTWAEVNGTTKEILKTAVLEENEMAQDENDWEDQDDAEMEVENVDGVEVLVPRVEAKLVIADRAASMEPVDEEDKIT